MMRVGDRDLLVTADALLEGTHFRLDEPGVTPDRVGWKLLAVSLSDIAAMGGVPRYAVATVGLPAGASDALKQGIVEGVHRCANEYDVAIIGGDVTSWPAHSDRGAGSLALSLTLFGEMPVGVPAIRRRGASEGDAIYVSGALGGSLRGRHLDVTPRLALGRWLAENRVATAMLDVSDGLSRDIGHICAASEPGPLGVEIDAASLPVHPDVAAMDGAGATEPWQRALDDGEDFELCFTVAPATAEAWDGSREIAGVRVTRVGRMLGPSAGRFLVRPDGSRVALHPGGWEHE